MNFFSLRKIVSTTAFLTMVSSFMGSTAVAQTGTGFGMKIATPPVPRMHITSKVQVQPEQKQDVASLPPGVQQLRDELKAKRDHNQRNRSQGSQNRDDYHLAPSQTAPSYGNGGYGNNAYGNGGYGNGFAGGVSLTSGYSGIQESKSQRQVVKSPFFDKNGKPIEAKKAMVQNPRVAGQATFANEFSSRRGSSRVGNRPVTVPSSKNKSWSIGPESYPVNNSSKIGSYSGN